MAKLPIRRGRGDTVVVELGGGVRTFLRDAAGAYRDLLTSDAAADDPAVARLSPTAYADDPLLEIGFSERTADDLERARMEAIETVLRTATSTSLTSDEADAWLRTCNGLRLVLGTRLDLTEESTPDDFAGDAATAAAFEQYALLSEIVELLVRALNR
jgi:hypothetical protein